MNELQLSLLGLGFVAILLVVIYNLWVEHKHRKSVKPAQQEMVAEILEPALGDDARQEPIWDHDAQVFDAGKVDQLGEPVITVAPVSIPEPIAALSEVESWVDAIATLRFYEPRTAGSIRETLNQMGASRFERVEFYSGDGWHRAEVLPDEALISNLRSRLQLASRRGPVSSDALHEWIRSLESLAQMLSAGLSVESESALIDRAANLDAFCARVDALISLNLKPAEDVAIPEQLGSIAGSLALAGDAPNFARLSATGDVDFQVQADIGASLISLIMDFPQVVRPDAVVADMLETAKTLAAKLSAEILDDAGRPMSEEGMALLVNQVIRLNATLQVQGIEPGSALARRLFS